MMDNTRKAFQEEVADLIWIDNETKPRVYEKVIFFTLPFIVWEGRGMHAYCFP